MKMPSLSIILVIFLFLLNVYVIAQTRGDQLEALRSAKTVKLVINQSLRANNSSYIRKVAILFLRQANVNVVESDTDSLDAILRIDLKGSKIGGYYRSEKSPYSKPVYLSTGVSLSGLISFEMGNMLIYQKKFKGRSLVPWRVAISRAKDVSDSGVLVALCDEGSFVHKIVEMIADVYGIKIIIETLKSDSMAREFGKFIVKVIINKKDPTAVESLIECLKCRSRFAAEALGEIKDPRAVQPLIEALQDSRIVLRQKAAEALGNIKDPGAVEPLINALNDEDAQVRLSAIIALGKIGGPRAFEVLLSRLKDGDIRSRTWAIYALGYTQNSRATELLIDALKDENSDVRNSAVEALGKKKDPRAIEPLIIALKDEDWSVRSDAKRVLINIVEKGKKSWLKSKKLKWEQKDWLKWWQKNKKKFLEK